MRTLLLLLLLLLQESGARALSNCFAMDSAPNPDLLSPSSFSSFRLSVCVSVLMADGWQVALNAFIHPSRPLMTYWVIHVRQGDQVAMYLFNCLWTRMTIINASL